MDSTESKAQILQKRPKRKMGIEKYSFQNIIGEG
jgi:hypothetical protein